MKRFADWRLGLALVGVVALGAVLAWVLGGDRQRGAATTAPAPSRVLADPLDPPAKRLPEPPAESPRPEAGPVGSADAGAPSVEGDRAKLARVKEMLQAKVRDGSASDAERRMLRALCRQLGDFGCAN